MSTKLVTKNVRLSYANIFKPKAMSAGQPEKYSVCLLIPKKDKTQVKKIQAAIEEEKKEWAERFGKGKIPAGLKSPLRDGDEEKDVEEHPEYAGMYFMNASSESKPILFDQEGDEILDQSEIYSGCWARASVNLFSYDTNGNRGIGAGLNAIKKVRDDEPFGAVVTAESALRDFEEEDDDMLD